MHEESPSPEVTGLLAAIGAGDAQAAERLFPIIYDELRRLASSYMLHERANHTLQPTALVHEAYLRLVKQDPAQARFQNREHFVATAAIAMRRILVNHAKSKDADKRGGGRPVLALDDAAATFNERAIDLLALDQALDRLAEHDAAQAKLVEMRFFGGLTVDQCADLLGISPRTAHSEWLHARAWLRNQLEGE